MIAKLVDKYLSDKNASGYSKTYEKLFENLRYNTMNILEIGIGTLEGGKSNMLRWKEKKENYQPGASLKVWKEYFENSQIYGIDVKEDCMISESRIKTFLCDSTSDESVGKLPDLNFDIIIDDGLHSFEAQNKTFKLFYPKLKKGGLYFIEDVRDYKKFFNVENELNRQNLLINKNDIGNLLWIKK
jgi:hypothetical protein